MKISKLIFLILIVLNSCVKWPSMCEADGYVFASKMQCKCKQGLKFRAYPTEDITKLARDATKVNLDDINNWTVIPECDGQPLPFTIDAKKLKGCSAEIGN